MKKLLSFVLCIAILLVSVTVPVSAITDYTENIESAVNSLRWWINNSANIAEDENFPANTVMDYTFAKFDPNEYGENYVDFGDWGYYETVVIPRATFENAAQSYFANFSIEELRSITKEKYDSATDAWVNTTVYNLERDAYVFDNPGGFGDSGRYVLESCIEHAGRYTVYSNFLEPFDKEYLPEDYVLNRDYFVSDDGEYYLEYCHTVKNVVYVLGGVVKFASWQQVPRQTNLTYEISNNEVTITGIPEGYVGALTIPSELDGYPVTKIGEYAFMENSTLTSITIPDSVTIIEDSAFWFCENLKGVNLGTGVISIGSNAFYACRSLKEISFPNSLKTIDSFAFQDCISLKTVTIPSSVTTIGQGAFINCHILDEILVDEENSEYSSLNGVLFNKDQTTLIAFPRGLGSSVSEYTVPDTVTEIDEYAFNYCEALTKITFTNNVAKIGYSAFYQTALTDVYFIGSEEDKENIDIGAYDNEPLLNATWHFNPLDDTTHEYTNKFDTKCNVCGAERTRNPKDFVINGVTYHITPTENGGVASVVGYNETILSNTTILSSVEDCPVNEISLNAFSDCETLVSIDIPKTVTNIGEGAFYFCSNLENVNLPSSITKINPNTFYCCDKLQSIVIPEGVTEIGEDAFRSTGLESITLPSSLKTIESGAFSYCNFEEFTVPKTVTYIGSAAFFDCNNLKKITLPFVGAEQNANKENTSDEMFSYIFSSWFGPPESLTEVVITAPCTTIELAAFNECSYIEKLTLPNTLTTIGKNAFSGCSSLKEISIGKAKCTPSETGLYNLEHLQTINISNDNPYYSLKDGILFNKNQTELIFSPRGIEKTTYAVPNTVTSIADRAFYRNEKLTSITLPNNLNSIGSNAFYYCTALKTINLPNTITAIGASAFMQCKNLQSVTIPSLLTVIEPSIFANCESLSKVIIPNKVTSIGESAFLYCINLKDLELGVNIKEIDTTAFAYCVSLENVTLPNKVTTIGMGAFAYCLKLNSILIPVSVTNIGEMAFYGDTALLNVYYTGSAQSKSQMVIGAENTPLLNATWQEDVDMDMHEHEYNIIKFNNEQHWTECECGEIDDENIYGHGYTRMYDKQSHWLECYCGAISSEGKEAHTFSGYKSNSTHHYKECTCGYQTTKSAHTYKTTITPATLTKTGTVVKKCSACNSSTTTKINCPKTFTLSTTSYTYTGSAKTPSVTVKDSAGKTLKKDTDYTVTYQSGRVNVGTYKVTIKMKGNYSGSKTLTFKINPQSISKCKLSLSATSYTYDGKAKTPSVMVKNLSGSKLTNKTHYTVTYSSGRKNVGTYKVTIKMKGNYSGSKTLTFNINPVKTTVSKLTAGKKSITVAITKKSTQVTGYQIQYSTSKTFSKATTKTVSSYKTTKYTLKSLSAKKTYYVRVRTYKTVGKTKYYSGWSTYKYVKTK